MACAGRHTPRARPRPGRWLHVLPRHVSLVRVRPGRRDSEDRQGHPAGQGGPPGLRRSDRLGLGGLCRRHATRRHRRDHRYRWGRHQCGAGRAAQGRAQHHRRGPGGFQARASQTVRCHARRCRLRSGGGDRRATHRRPGRRPGHRRRRRRIREVTRTRHRS